jgi:hypothetical protein
MCKRSTRLRWSIVVPGALLLAACPGSGGIDRPEPLPPGVVTGSQTAWLPGLQPAGAGPHQDEPDVDAAELPRDPAALPGTVLRWRTGVDQGWFGPGPTVEVFWSPGSLVVARDDQAGAMVAYDLADGTERWRLRLPPGPYALDQMPSVERDGRLFVASADFVLAADVATGAPLWETQVHGTPDGPGFVVAGKLILRTLYRRPQDPADPTSLPDWDAPAETTLLALDVATGATAWKVAVAENTELAVSSQVAIVVEHVELGAEAGEGDAAKAVHGLPDDAIDAEVDPLEVVDGVEGAEDSGEYVEPSYRTVISLYGVADGAPAGGATFDGYLARPEALGDLLLIVDDVVNEEDEQAIRLSALRLPSLERVWQYVARELNLDFHPAGDEVLLQDDQGLALLDAATGAQRASVDLASLMPVPPQWPAGEDWDPARCLGSVTVAGDSLLYVTNNLCAKQVVLLDGATLRPWRVTMGFDESSGELFADERTAVLGVPGGLAAIDLASVGPSLNESQTYDERLGAYAVAIEDGSLMLGYPLDQAAQEFLLAGDEVAESVRAALSGARIAAKLFAVTVLKYRPDPAAVPAMLAAFGPPSPPTYGGGFGERPAPEDLQIQFLGRLLEALAACGDARAAPLLAGVFDDAEVWGEGARSLAMQGLAAIGTPEALARIDAWREGRSRRTEPWQPPAREGTAGRRFDDGGWAGGEGEGAGADDATRRTSPDGKVVAMIAYAAGGTSDLWLMGEASGILVPLFTGVTSTYGLGIVSVTPTPDGAQVVVNRIAGGPNCAICGMMADMEGQEGPTPVEETLVFRWEELRRDGDGDGWSDLLEKRLRTDPGRTDTDGDGLADGVDPAPRGVGPAATGPCAPEEVLRAAFFGNFAFVEATVPLFVTGTPDTNLQYDGYPGPVIWLSDEESEALREEVGLDGATYFNFEQEMEEGPDDTWHPAGRAVDGVVFSEDGTAATVNVGEFRGSLNGIGHEIKLRCVEGKWYPVSIEMTWIS